MAYYSIVDVLAKAKADALKICPSIQDYHLDILLKQFELDYDAAVIAGDTHIDYFEGEKLCITKD